MNLGRDGRSDLAERLRETAEDLVELVSAQIKLMRLELLRDARAVGRLLAFAPLLILGYAFLAAGLAAALAPSTGLVGALLLVGAGQLAVGAWGLLRAARAFRRLRLLPPRARGE